MTKLSGGKLRRGFAIPTEQGKPGERRPARSR
jgi:hypothetical protein